ncbi:hypothetical protein L6452_44073 [Arctium lappa]|uniref:Uncharacterized protein n=1 Tax=Arctium lappa TaxID=4217 RepID=A0ACB8XF67_ARCLA|nr:hypothetical protein L6452_44073 [Arctium lappa]
MKSYRDNGGGGGGFGARNKTVYDDVFGGPPKFGATTLPPRVEDYTEIFQGFHASRGSSIPVLDLPPPSEESDDVWFDVQSSKLDYSEVFGGFNGLDFAVSYEELFNSSKVGDDDSSDEVWTPAQSESPSDESDPYASLETNQHVSTADPNQLFGVKLQNEPNMEAEKDMVNDSQFLDLCGSTVIDNQALPSNMENEKLFSLANNDRCASKDFGGVAEGKRLKKSLSQPLDSVCGTERYGCDISHLVGDQKADPVGTRPVLFVSDVSLKTQPSHLPPPSRPPPALTSKKGDTGSSNLKLKTSKSYAFERMTGDQSPPYFDVEIDATSSAAADAAAMKDAVEQAQAKLRSAKELMDRKKEGLQGRSKLRMENNVGDKKGRVNEDYERANSFGGKRMNGSIERDSTRTRLEVRGESQNMKIIKDVKGSVDGERNVTEAGKTIERKTMKEHKMHLVLDETKGTVSAREVTQPFENVVRRQVKDGGIAEPDARSRGFKQNNKAVLESFQQKEDGKHIQEREFCGLVENDEARETLDRSHREEEHLKEPTIAQKTCQPRETGKKFFVSQQHGEVKTPSDADESEFYENLIEIQLKDNDMETGRKLVGANEKVVIENLLKNDNKREAHGKSDPYDWEDLDVGFHDATEKEHDKGLKETEEQDEKEAQQPVPPEIAIIQSEEEEDHEEVSESIVKDSFCWEDYEKMSVKASEQWSEESDKISETVSEHVENKSEQTPDHIEEILQEDVMQNKDKIKAEEALEQDEKVKKKEKACAEDDVQTLNHAGANENTDTIHEMECNSEENRKLLNDHDREESKKGEEAVSENDGIEKEQEGIKWDDDNKRPSSNKENESSTGENSEASDVVYQVDDNEILQATGDVQLDMPSERNEATPETLFTVENGKPRSNGHNEKVEGTVDQIHEVGEESFSSSGLNQNGMQGVKVEVRVAGVPNSIYSNESAGKIYGVNVIGQTPMGNDKRTSDSKNSINFTHNHEGKRTNVHPEGRTNTTTYPQVAKEWVEAETKPLTDQVDSLKNTNNTASKVAGRSMERKDEIRNKAVSEDRGKEEKLQKERELENERLRKIEEERERQIEREKDRMAIDRATLEARERAFAETRERAERAAVDRATAEFRQRALVEARERLEKACAEARERSLAEKAMEGRLRVEKATAEARERAERSVGDKFSASKSSLMRQNSLSSDLPDLQFQKAGSYSGLRYSQTAAQNGGEGESPQRCKARLERHQRTADRAAKALAEKNMRDLIAQKEQAERNRLAEGLDAEVKRWCSGKQGNLRALLSTLQYILGSDSGWQPVPLTEVITTAAVKKAYRKATLCVHPDKLQQRGATIQQKYICEKVFDLLKEAWNKFNSEER